MPHLFSFFALTLLSVLFLTGCQDDTAADLTQEVPIRTLLDPSNASNPISNSELALRWAPIHYQDTDVTGKYSLDGQSDYVTAINFDGDWNATNNWDNTEGGDLSAHAYYSVVETTTHWFITYAFFHPRDWTDVFFLYYLDQHENDLEGILLAVRKDGSPYGTLQAAISVAHTDFYSFVPDGSVLEGNEEDIDGTLSFENYSGSPHPLTAQEAKGHGLKAYPYYKINGGDGIKYYPSLTTAEVPADPNDRQVSYRLVDIFETNGLWQQRFNTEFMESPAGAFLSSVGSGNANAPWAWDDRNDEAAVGTLATDPAGIMGQYFKNWDALSATYTNNPYQN